MRFLVDNNLSVHLPVALAALGHDAVHARAMGLGDASDEQLLERAGQDHRIMISGDRDFSALLAELNSAQPSVVYIRSRVPRHPGLLAPLPHSNLTPIEAVIADGRIVVIEPHRIRIRTLPLSEE